MKSDCPPSKNKKQGVAYSYAPIICGFLLFVLTSARPTQRENAPFPYEFDVQHIPFIWNWVSGGLICMGFGWRLTPEAIGHKLPDWKVAEKVGGALLAAHLSNELALSEENTENSEKVD